MKTERVSASKKAKKRCQLGEELPIFSATSNVDLYNLNLSVTTNIRNLLTPFIQQARRKRFSKPPHQMYGPKPNLNNNFSDIICDKDLVVKNKILKVNLLGLIRKIYPYYEKLKT